MLKDLKLLLEELAERIGADVGKVWGLIKLNNSNEVEVGHKDKPLSLSASRISWLDGATSRSLLTTKDFDVGSKTLYRKSEIDSDFVNKDDLEKILVELRKINRGN